MSDMNEQQNPDAQGAEPPITIRQILKENWILTRALIFFILMLSVPLIVAWKLDLFLVANN
jgi:hypothetical protein